MLYFASDYQETACEPILRRLLETAGEHMTAYGSDRYCASAQEKIRAACAAPAAEVRFLTGGTQTNQVAIDALLKPWEGVVATAAGHVAGHEAGAIEYSGHKVLTLPSHGGKLDPGEDPLACAKRELHEETGLVAERMAFLTSLATTPGFTDERIHLYMATGLSFGPANPDEDEFLNVDLVPLDELIDAVLDGRIEDSKTVCGALICDAVAHRLEP